MVNFKLLFFALLCLISWQTVQAQEQLGIRLDNYTGLDQASLNPAFSASSPLTFDVRLAGIGFYGENNYGFIHHTSILDMRNKTDFVSAFDLEGKTPPDNALVGDVFDTKNKKYGKINITVAGPAVMVRLGQHSFGLFTNMRAVFSVTDIPSTLGYYEYDRIPYDTKFKIAPFKAAGAIWNETGIHYGYEAEKSNGTISMGINLKYNSFLESGFFGVQKEMGYTKISPDSVHIDYPAIEFAITTGNLNRISVDMNNKDVNVGSPSIDWYGHSWSADLGTSIQIEDSGVDGYRWRAGVSLLDFGLAKLKRKSEFHTSYPIPDSLTIDFEDLKNAQTLDQLEKKLSNMALNDPDASLKANSFKMGLPTAVSLQGDYQFVQNVFIGGVIVQPFGLSRYNLKRPAVLAVSPRFENRFFSFSMPVVLRDWRSARIGLAGRLGFVSFGTDNLGSFIRKKNFTGTDFYMAIRINAVNLPQFFQGSGRKDKRPSLGCYKF